MLCKYRNLIQSLLLLVLLAAGSAIMAAAACPAQALEITDATGHTVSLKDHPQRIALAGKGTILVQNTVYLFGEAEERVIALENRRQSAFRFLPVVDPHISGKSFFAVNAGPEQIAAVKPDLVLMKNFMAGPLGRPLEKLDLPVLYLNLETPGAFYRDIQTLGAVFGNPERAEEIDRFYRSRVQQVRSLVADTGETPRVLILQHSRSGGAAAFNVPPASWIQARLVKLAGGDPVWEDIAAGNGWRIVTVEQIAAWDPDQIFLIDYQGKAPAAAERLRQDPIWKNLRAVANNHLHAFAFDFYSWDQPDPRWILGLQWLATRLHPEAAAEIRIGREVRSFYSTLYRLDAETIESEVLPKLTEDIP